MQVRIIDVMRRNGFGVVSRERGHRMSGSGLLANLVGGGLALLLLVYLFIALIRPEKF